MVTLEARINWRNISEGGKRNPCRTRLIRKRVLQIPTLSVVVPVQHEYRATRKWNIDISSTRGYTDAKAAVEIRTGRINIAAWTVLCPLRFQLPVFLLARHAISSSSSSRTQRHPSFNSISRRTIRFPQIPKIMNISSTDREN